MALITPADVTERHTPEAAPSTDAAALVRAIDAAESQAAEWLGWPPVGTARRSVESASHVCYLDGPAWGDARELALPLYPVSSITSIYDDALEAYGSATLVDSAQYTLIGREGRVRLTGTATHAWSVSRRAIKVTCIAGWTTATMEHALREALLRLAAHHYRAPRGARVESASRGGQTAAYRPLRMPRDVQQLLAPYRLPAGVGLGATGM